MDFVNSRIQRWMPGGRRAAVDSSPRLHGIFDSINSTLATSLPETRLPAEFYDRRLRRIIDRICTEEEYAGYKESLEYRTLGIGDLLSEMVQAMRKSARIDTHGGRLATTKLGKEPPKFAMFGCHDSTIAAILASLGAFEGAHGTWPSYSSSLAVELLCERTSNANIDDRSSYYVRLRYNDTPVRIPACGAAGRHMNGDKTFCTFVGTLESNLLSWPSGIANPLDLGCVQPDRGRIHACELENGMCV